MAVSGKRLFWVSIIIVELVLVYVAYRPVRDHLQRNARRMAVARPTRRSENPSSTVAKNNAPNANTANPSDIARSTSSAPKASASQATSSNATATSKTNAPVTASSAKPVIATAKPSPIPRPHPRPRASGLVVNAGLKTPEPVPGKPAALAPTTESPLDSFWCRISKAESDCDCKKGEEQAANHVMR